jgi:membrane protease subunit HflC
VKTRYIIILIVALLAIVGLMQSSYIVQEYEQVVITQFGKPVGEAIVSPGLYFKVPFIQKTNYFEKRFMEWDGDPNQVPTKDKKFIFIDAYARWQITDPLQFFKRMTNERIAQSRIDDIIDGETRNFVAKHNLEELVRSSNRKPLMTDTTLGLPQDSLTKIYVGRESIQHMILDQANKESADLGIVILDFRFKRINYVKEVQDQVYERMRSERFNIAEKFRSEGQGEASKINGEKGLELMTIQSEAFKKSEEIKGKADAEAAKIYASAYNQSEQSKYLYAFLKSMETFEKTFNSRTSIILSTDSELYKYLKSSN